MPFSVKKIKGIDTSDLEKLGASVVDLAKYTEDEFSQVASALQGTDPNPIWNRPLPRPRRGTTIYADGTNWNPGFGEGPYWFDGTLYHPMGQNAVTGAITDAPNDGQSYVRKSLGWTVLPPPAPISASLGADVLLNNVGNYFPGPSIAQGSIGTWWVSGTVSCQDTAGAAAFLCKLWDGVTVIASAFANNSAINFVTAVSLSGFISAPAGNLRISVRDSTSASGKILFNSSGNSKDSTISAYRIA